MKRVLKVVTVVMIVLGFFQFGALKTANAGFLENPGLAPNSWEGGVEVKVDFEKNPLPEWLKFLGNPVKVTEPGTICHDFRGGQFFWAGEIRELKNGKWVKIPSTAGWYPTVEGKYRICAEAPEAGIYALFAYFDPPEGYVPVSEEHPE